MEEMEAKEVKFYNKKFFKLYFCNCLKKYINLILGSGGSGGKIFV